MTHLFDWDYKSSVCDLTATSWLDLLFALNGFPGKAREMQKNYVTFHPATYKSEHNLHIKLDFRSELYSNDLLLYG